MSRHVLPRNVFSFSKALVLSIYCRIHCEGEHKSTNIMPMLFKRCCCFFLLLISCSITERFTVVVSFFSGIPNPQWSVSDNEELTGLLVKSLKAGILGHPSQMPARLGFRGILIEDAALDLGKVLLLGSKTTELQMAILKTMPQGMLKQGDLDDIEDAINAGDLDLKEPPIFPVRGKRYAPPYQPAVWNALVPAYRRQRCNNCYNYATRRATDTFAQPGYGSGRIYTRNAGGGLVANPHTGANLIAAAERDGLTQLHPHPGAAAPVPGAPAHAWRHLVALVVKPGK